LRAAINSYRILAVAPNGINMNLTAPGNNKGTQVFNFGAGQQQKGTAYKLYASAISSIAEGPFSEVFRYTTPK
jgi:hypothetical protein